MVVCGDDIAFLWSEREGRRYIDRLYLSLPAVRREIQKRENRMVSRLEDAYRSMDELHRSLFEHVLKEELGDYLRGSGEMLEQSISRIWQRYREMESGIYRELRLRK